MLSWETGQWAQARTPRTGTDGTLAPLNHVPTLGVCQACCGRDIPPFLSVSHLSRRSTPVKDLSKYHLAPPAFTPKPDSSPVLRPVCSSELALGIWPACRMGPKSRTLDLMDHILAGQVPTTGQTHIHAALLSYKYL